MMNDSGFSIDNKALSLVLQVVPWDSEVFGVAVAQIENLRVDRSQSVEPDFSAAQAWLDANKIEMVSCRLGHDRLDESFFLEQNGFRFIEMVLHPQIAALGEKIIDDQGLSVSTADIGDLQTLVGIAESAFGCERYHVDPRVDSEMANRRYGNWVKSAFVHPRQVVLKVEDNDQVVALFVVETIAPGYVYWHLTAVAPGFQGRGLGLRAWRAMLNYHQKQEALVVRTTISARNVRVLNLYSRLGFSFLPPEMTFHWVRA